MGLCDLLRSDEASRERDQRAYDVGRVTTEVTSAIEHRMEQAGITPEELARRLGGNPSRVASILRINPEAMTLRTLARLAVALDATVEVQLVAEAEE
jgi:plasmid maintenance system antidote protein VapI